jgi:hypothetical protein
VRFTAEPARKVKDNTIPSSKVSASSKVAKNPKKSSKRQKKIKVKEEVTDGLKYMNLRQDLLNILEKKKTDASKLAWKVTECYPF